MTIILGAGLAGLSSSYHLKHDCLIVEKQDHAGGHIYSHKINGFVWDEGPHVSFTKHEYVKNLFAESTEFTEFPVFPINHYKGSWVPHPAQANLFAVPEPMRTKCLESFLNSRTIEKRDVQPSNYKEWLLMAFGEVFANEFPTVYTKKYWTVGPELLTSDWVGERVFYPEVEDVKEGYISAPVKSKHYQTSVRYPVKGGYYSYSDKLRKEAKIKYNKEVVSISLSNKIINFADGTSQQYERLINTMPLPEFISKTEAPDEIKKAAEQLSCSEVLLINVVVNHKAPIINQWIYVYDEEKYSTRINFTELLSVNNGESGKSGIQVEVYFSKYRSQTKELSEIVNVVCNELVEMGLVESTSSILEINTHKIKYANVIFDHHRRKALDKIFHYLESYGLKRDSQDLDPMTDWKKMRQGNSPLGNLIMAGRFGEWKYYWTDDCVMRGLHISENL